MYSLIYTSLSQKALNSYKNYLTISLKKFNLKFIIIALPKKRKKKTLLKSPHVNKKAKETFEVLHYRFICMININNKYLHLFHNNIPKLIHLKWSKN